MVMVMVVVEVVVGVKVKVLKVKVKVLKAVVDGWYKMNVRSSGKGKTKSGKSGKTLADPASEAETKKPSYEEVNGKV